MKPFMYYKLKAKKELAGNLIKLGVVSVFSLLLTVFSSLYLNKIYTESITKNIIAEAVANVFILQPFAMGFVVFLMNHIKKKKAGVGDIFDGYKYFLKLIPYSVISIAIAFASAYLLEVIHLKFTDGSMVSTLLSELLMYVLIIVPLIIQMLLRFTMYILYDEDISGIKAIIKSIKMAKGHIIYLIAVNLSFLMWFLLVPFTLGIILAYIIPYMEITLIMVYEDWKNPDVKLNDEERKSEE